MKRDESVDREVLSVPFVHNEERYLRLRCLEIAVATFDPDSPIDNYELLLMAEMTFYYVATGKIMTRPRPEEPAGDDGFVLPTDEDQIRGPLPDGVRPE